MQLQKKITNSCAIVIPLYNKEKQIWRCLNSIFLQEIPFNQVIIVDDCSKDGSVALVEKFISDHPEAAIQLIKHAVNGGPGAARNTGLSILNCEYVCFLDADDFLENTASKEIHRVLNSCMTAPGILIYRVREQGSGIIRPSFSHLNKSHFSQMININLLRLTDWASAMVNEALFCSGGNVLISKKLLSCRFDPTLRNFEDWDYYFRVCQLASNTGLEILISSHIGLTYTEEDNFSLSRASIVSPSLRSPPPFIANTSLPLQVRKYTAGIWLSHVAQRSTWHDGLLYIRSAVYKTGDAKPSFKHVIAAIFLLLIGRSIWRVFRHLRKRLRYV